MDMIQVQDLPKRLSEDEVFAFMYPLCTVMGEDTEEIVADIKRTAKVSSSPVMVIATAYRQRLTEKSAGISRKSD